MHLQYKIFLYRHSIIFQHINICIDILESNAMGWHYGEMQLDVYIKLFYTVSV